MSDKVILIIKAANQSSVDQRIECDLDWKILYLKEEISKIHPAKPSIEEQRLIYSGQLLQDAFLLRTVLRHPSENNEYTIHMVCSSLKAASTVKTPQEQSTSYPPPVITNESNSQNESASSSDSTGDGLRHRFQSEQIPAIGVQQQGFNTSALYSPIPQLPPPFQTMADPVQQMAAMQEMYAQYMASYMQYIQSGSLESGRFFQEATPSPPPPPTSTGIPAELDNQEVRREPQNQQQQQQQQPNNDQEPQRNAQVRPNQGMVGEGEEDEMAARDWLDYIYFASRMMVLFSIVYFYSTLTRFLVVTLFALMIYLYQCGCFRMWRNENLVEPPAVQRQQPPGEAAAPEQQQRAAEEQDEGTPPSQAAAATSVAATTTTTTTAQPGPEEMSSAYPPPTSSSSNSETLLQQQQQQREENERGGDAMEASILERAEEDEEEEEVQNAPSSSPTPPFSSQAPPPQPPSLLSLMWTFVTTLFTSLLPEQHQPQIL